MNHSILILNYCLNSEAKVDEQSWQSDNSENGDVTSKAKTRKRRENNKN